MNDEIMRQLAKLEKKEIRYIKKRTKPNKNRTSDKPILPIPQGLNNTLKTAFYKGFQLVFQKGGRLLEKTYDKKQLLLDHELLELGFQKNPSKRNLSQISQQAGKSAHLHGLTTAMEGSLMGILGVGLPDIPIFIGILLKTIYQIALSYGFLYDAPEEQYYILKLIETALAGPQDFLRLNAQADAAAYDLNLNKRISFDLNLQTHAAADALADEMIMMKFIQGLPVIGIVGGVSNFACHQKIIDYVLIKYRKRYLLKKSTTLF